MDDGHALLRQVDALVARSLAVRPQAGVPAKREGKHVYPAAPSMAVVRRVVQFLPTSLSFDGQLRFVQR